MQTLTFTQKLLRQRRFLSFLFPLFAVFVGLGSVQSVRAAATLGDRTVFITTNGGGVQTFPAAAFDNTVLGRFDINSGQLTLEGGSLTVNLTGATTATSANLFYSVTDPMGGPVSSGTIALVPGTASATSRTFTTNNAGRNLLANIAAIGDGFTVSVTYNATTFTPGTGPGTGTRTIQDGFYYAYFDVTGNPIPPTAINNSNIYVNTTGDLNPNIIYGGSSGKVPQFQGSDLGTYDINNGELTLNGGTVNTFERFGEQIQNVRLIYQLQKPVQPASPGIPATTSTINFAPSNIALTLVPNSTTTTANGNIRQFANVAELRNIIASLAATDAGTYNITVSFQGDLFRNGSFVGVITDPALGGFTASFKTTGTPFPTNTWEGLVSDDWFNPDNWTLRLVPGINTNVIIPNYNSGSANIAPNIRAAANGPAMARNVDLQGSSQAQRSILRLVDGRFIVSGSFFNRFDTFIQRTPAGLVGPSVIEFSSPGNAQISGGTFTTVEISGSGRKALTGLMNVDVALTFLATGGIVTTDVSRPIDNVVKLSGRSSSAPNGAQVNGETEIGYVRGFMETSRIGVVRNEVDANGQIRARTYGNMGMTINFKGDNDPGDVRVTRNTAESYTPLVGPNGGTARYGIRRIFGVRPNSPFASSGGLIADLTFRYLDSELSNLGPQGTGSVPESSLALFVSTSGGNQFGFLGRDGVDLALNILTKSNVRTFATFTLGDINNPLPVSLTGFDAKRIGADALVTWQTASEQNNKGFNVQVSTDGKNYRTIGFVASETPNSTSPKAYTFTDTEKNKAGARYYRLEQLDVNGKTTFFAPRVVTFDGKATEANSGIVAYPNPLNNEILHLSLNSSVSGTGVVRVLDMTGRQVAQRNLAITIGSNDVAIENMSELKSGLYILNVMLPSGEKKTMKVVKQ